MSKEERLLLPYRRADGGLPLHIASLDHTITSPGELDLLLQQHRCDHLPWNSACQKLKQDAYVTTLPHLCTAAGRMSHTSEHARPRPRNVSSTLYHLISALVCQTSYSFWGLQPYQTDSSSCCSLSTLSQVFCIQQTQRAATHFSSCFKHLITTVEQSGTILSAWHIV